MRAQLQFHDVAPFPIAWLYFQQGLMWERVGNLPRARELFSAAVLRLPSYAAAISHLAAAEAVGLQRDQAIARLRALLETADDPEYKGQLAQLLKESGKTEEAAALAAKARSEYAALLARHPRAFASHSARFYLGAGDDPQAALKWAESNLAAVPTSEAVSLAVEAATAAKASARACALADQLTKMSHLSAQAHIVASRAYTACGQRERASAESAAALK
jgi:tetratricopeptide (TPR) repeat protein